MDIKDKHKGQTAFIAACGPSLEDYTKEQYQKETKDDIVICVKQAQYEFIEECDYHIINDNNLVYYSYPTKTEIVGSSAQKYDFSRYCSKSLSYLFRVLTDMNINNTVAGLKNFNLNEIKSSDPYVTWGPGIMYEIVVPFVVHCGFSHVKFIGWDYTVNKEDGHLNHFYDHNNRKVFHNPAHPLDKNEAELVIESSEILYSYLQSKGVTSEILSNKSNISDAFPRRFLK